MHARRRNGDAMYLLENNYVSNIAEITARYFTMCLAVTSRS